MDCVESFKQSKVHVEVTHKETDAVPNRSNSSSSCASDLSQESSIFQSDPPALQPKPDVVESPGASQTVENSTSSISRMQSSSENSSQIRLSGVLGNHDPNRIPVSIFSGKPSNPMEWSTASNESLFSIHVGNSSFSRDHFNFLNKSGELMMNPNLAPYSSNIPPFGEPPKVESKNESTGNGFAESLTSTGSQNPAIPGQNAADHHTKEVVTPMDELRGRNSVSNRTDDSMNSSHSFQFPLLGGDGATPKTASSVSTDSTTNTQLPVKLQSVKQQSPEHKSPSQETASASLPANTGWFSCFSWCRRR